MKLICTLTHTVWHMYVFMYVRTKCMYVRIHTKIFMKYVYILSLSLSLSLSLLLPPSPHSLTGELDANRPVPFRLTPALQNLISQISLAGPLQLSMVAAARCLVQPHFCLESILRAVLRDEFIAWRKVRIYKLAVYLSLPVSPPPPTHTHTQTHTHTHAHIHTILYYDLCATQYGIVYTVHTLAQYCTVSTLYIPELSNLIFFFPPRNTRNCPITTVQLALLILRMRL